MTFAEKLRELRLARSLSRQQLADASGVARTTIRDYEQGRREPLWDVLFKLSRALNVDCEAFADAALADDSTPPISRPAKAMPSTPPAADLEATAKKPRGGRRRNT
jgi:transcriptional regulator with XRE-family HTH domain